MKNFLIGVAVLAVAVGLFGAGFAFAPKSISLGSYIPPIQSGSGFSQFLSTSTALAATSFCTPTNIQFIGTSATATGTLATATSTYAACNSPAFGASVEGLIVNDSTNTVNLVAGTGVLFKCETSDVGTSTISSGACTQTQVSVPASTTMYFAQFFDGSSSTLKIDVGNTWY